jgi:hypothetical protein
LYNKKRPTDVSMLLLYRALEYYIEMSLFIHGGVKEFFRSILLYRAISFQCGNIKEKYI